MTAPAVVFGIDFSPIMRRAIPWTREFIAPGQPVVLAHAIDAPPLPGFLRKRIVPSSLAAREVCPQVMARLQTIAEWAGVSGADRETRGGRADEVLRDIAAERGASLVVIGAHGVPAPAWRRVGTTAERLLRAAEQSVMVVKGAMVGPPKRIVVALDDATITPCVIARAGAIAQTNDSELHAVHVLSAAAYSHLVSAEAAEALDEADQRKRIEQDLAQETLRWLRELWENTRRHSRVDAHVRFGVPAEEILHVARDEGADLIVIGRYGLGRAIPAMLGSVLGSVIAGAECPVLVVNG